MDVAQQAFSSENGSTLHLAIPALKTLYKSWLTQANKVKYTCFAAALSAGAAKINKYYEKTTDKPAFVMAIGISFSSNIWLIVC